MFKLSQVRKQQAPSQPQKAVKNTRFAEDDDEETEEETEEEEETDSNWESIR